LASVQVRFGQKLRALREARGYSQMKLAGLTGIERTLISSCEHGRRNVSLVTIEKFAKGLRCKMSELMPE